MSVYVVLGARGGTGCEIVRRLTEQPASEVAEIRAVVRDPTKVSEGLFGEDTRVKLLAGDCAQVDSLRKPLAGAAGVFFAAAGKGHDGSQAVDQTGVAEVAKLAKEVGVGRLVLVSSQLVHPNNRFHFVRALLNTFVTGLFHRRGMMDFKFEGEQLLRASGQEYCIVRPGRLVDAHKGQEKALRRALLRVGQCNASFLNGGAIARADLAAVCVVAMTVAGARNTTFEVGSETPLDPKDPDAPRPEANLFDGLDSQWDNSWTERIVGKRWGTVDELKN